ncbi:MAG: hypothetical protein A2119_02640 [Candidatus Colwellbacteria bacterium GWA2_46_10]|uniref:Uncharacterized protein n=1 Tax=Candidatus Colwellbacteria bacterium GWA2_46_10 TaxID=1797684 RepID=A0A1G1YYN8_9BACT|nr:MAG: hypothetical protein UX29_C0013G0002 [Parcubacteria group bacterium GW2011_GWA2_46_10]OGY56896.1 MAG: hypothetical protein A2119_02640 [Candidatus Colwellbacteria bacterium GWA2_46_10]
MKLSHKFVKNIPDTLENGVVYVSMDYSTAIHKCCCGCGNEIVTPLSPTDWKLSFDGETISLYPSIGNWSLPCQSHYWITDNEVEWASRWTKRQIERGRIEEEQDKEKYYGKKKRRSIFGFFKK